MVDRPSLDALTAAAAVLDNMVAREAAASALVTRIAEATILILREMAYQRQLEPHADPYARYGVRPTGSHSVTTPTEPSPPFLCLGTNYGRGRCYDLHLPQCHTCQDEQCLRDIGSKPLSQPQQ